MSESAAHRAIVIATAKEIKERHPHLEILTDIQEAPGMPVPSLIAGHRPDIIASAPSHDGGILIAEAKTPGDVDNLHTRSQASAFVGHLRSRRRGVGTFVFAVSGRKATSEARNLLRYTVRDYVSSRVCVQLFDGLDFWTLGGPKEDLWRLS